jgi:hypothetical protein
MDFNEVFIFIIIVEMGFIMDFTIIEVLIVIIEMDSSTIIISQILLIVKMGFKDLAS